RVAVDQRKLLADQLVQERIGAQRVLEDETGRLARGERDARGERGRPGPEVRRQSYVIGGGDRADAHALGEPAGDGEIGLEHVGAPQLGDLAEVVAGGRPPPRRGWGPRGAGGAPRPPPRGGGARPRQPTGDAPLSPPR